MTDIYKAFMGCGSLVRLDGFHWIIGLLRVLEDGRIAVIGIAGGVEGGGVEPADGFSLPFIRITP